MSDLNLKPKAAAGGGGMEDAGTQALADALKSSFVLVRIALVCLVVYFACSNFFTVKQSERAVVLRFGEPVGRGEEAVLGPGFHVAWPYPVDEVVKLPAEQILSASSTVGWYRMPKGPVPANLPVPPSLNPLADGYSVTGDGNIIHAQATLRYRVADPVRFYFGFTNAPMLVTNILDNAVLAACAQFNADDALRLNLAALRERMAARVQQLAREKDLGIAVEQLELVTAIPRQVKAAYEQVTSAENELSTRVNEAQAYANGVLARAQGEAAGRKNAAEGDRDRTLAEVEAEAQYFTDQLPAFKANPDLFVRRLQIESVGRVMTNAQDKFFLPARADGQPREVRLQLNREPQRLKSAVEAPKTGEHKH